MMLYNQTSLRDPRNGDVRANNQCLTSEEMNGATYGFCNFASDTGQGFDLKHIPHINLEMSDKMY